MYRKQVRRRRAVLVGLIVGSLILLSAHFSEADSGPLHVIQRATATVFDCARLLGIKRVVTHGEKAAAYIVDAYARASRRPLPVD